MSYKVIDRSSYYRKGVFRHFSKDCKCSLSMTARVDVTELAAWSKRTGLLEPFWLRLRKLVSRLSLMTV